MLHRPLSITLIGLILLSWGIFDAMGVVSTVRLVTGEGGWSEMVSRDGFLLALVVVAGVVEFLAGANILRGKNWARVLWAGWCVLDLILKYFLGLDTPLLTLGIQFFALLFLLTPEADAFFEVA
jgi:hypothetical protein